MTPLDTTPGEPGTAPAFLTTIVVLLDVGLSTPEGIPDDHHEVHLDTHQAALERK